MRIVESKRTPGMWYIKGNVRGADKILFVCYHKEDAMFEMSRRKSVNQIKKEK